MARTDPIIYWISDAEVDGITEVPGCLGRVRLGVSRVCNSGTRLFVAAEVNRCDVPQEAAGLKAWLDCKLKSMVCQLDVELEKRGRVGG